MAINLLGNALLGETGSIRLSGQEFPSQESQNRVPEMVSHFYVNPYLLPVLLVFFLYPALALLVVHPIRETETNVKHLQRMAGASCLAYWGAMFLFDFVLLALLTLVVVLGFVIMDASLGLALFGATEIRELFWVFEILLKMSEWFRG